ncbi:MAG TPA: adenylate kinase [Candidatus Brocadiia bacterium]|nr:adenylate kinase [Planctomycetota bacterium]MBI4008205.1 adenylate kinase [Planctomycetota bacterium]MDO8092445.1 adenylate kinase [Candidatus Brocadiales bacterium]
MNIVFLGPPGAGKGTQAETISNTKGLLHISTGDLLRQAVKDGTSTGVSAKEYMEKGLLVPDDVVLNIIAERISSDDHKHGFVLDGFPRTLVQAKALDETLRNIGERLDVVFYFAVSEDTAIQRLSGRRTCKTCGANYHVQYIPPLKEGICDKCGGQLYQRTDDKPETIAKRLRVYKEQTEGLIDYYKRNKVLKEVKGDWDVDKTYRMITKVLETIPKHHRRHKEESFLGDNSEIYS